MKLAITGSSGNIGGMMARHLSERGFSLILPLRSPAKAPNLPSIETRRFSYGDFELAKRALAEVDALSMVSTAESPTREQEHLTLVRASEAASMRHLVYLPFAGAALDSTFPLARTHAVTENAIRQRDYPDMPDWESETWVSTYTAIAKGELAEVSPDLAQLLGRTSLTFKEVVKAEYAK